MKKNYKENLTDELRPEYDLNKMQVVARGPKRKAKAEQTVSLDPDVAEIFPDSIAVNEALRFLIRVARHDSLHQKPRS